MMVTLYRLLVQPASSLTACGRELFRESSKRKENERREHHPAIGINFPGHVRVEDGSE